MKRSPIARRTPLRSGRKPIPARSARRIAELPLRAECRRIVLERDRFCRMRITEPCKTRAAESTDVHELWGGSNRSSTYLDPDKCIGGCRPCHDYVTAHPAEATAAGLSKRSGDR